MDLIERVGAFSTGESVFTNVSVASTMEGYEMPIFPY
jgi:hypothetical protein